jgi:hypothetical protein
MGPHSIEILYSSIFWDRENQQFLGSWVPILESPDLWDDWRSHGPHFWHKVDGAIFVNCVSIWLILWTLQFSSTPPCNLIDSHFRFFSHFLLDLFGVPDRCWWILMIIYCMIYWYTVLWSICSKLESIFDRCWYNFNLCKSIWYLWHPKGWHGINWEPMAVHDQPRLLKSVEFHFLVMRSGVLGRPGWRIRLF